MRKRRTSDGVEVFIGWKAPAQRDQPLFGLLRRTPDNTTRKTFVRLCQALRVRVALREGCIFGVLPDGKFALVDTTHPNRPFAICEPLVSSYQVRALSPPRILPKEQAWEIIRGIYDRCGWDVLWDALERERLEQESRQTTDKPPGVSEGKVIEFPGRARRNTGEH